MSALPSDPVAREQAIRESVRARWAGLPDSGVVHGRERDADSLAEYLRLFSIKDAANGNKTVIRGAMVKLVRPEPLTEDATGHCMPLRYVYAIEVIYQFEDTRKDGTNSSDGFNALIIRGFEAFKDDAVLGFQNLSNKPVTPTQDAEVVDFDQVRCHVTALELQCEVHD